jgi:hypothetical protein
MSDEFHEQFLNAPDTKEALSWLRGGSDQDFRSIGELETNEESVQLVELIYTAGAVLAVEIDEFEHGQNTDSLLIQLPDDAAKRKRILQWAGTIAEQQGLEPESDTGQRYILLTFE